MSDEITSASQSEVESVEIERDAETESLYDSFGIAPVVDKKEIEMPDLTKQNGNLDESAVDPAIDQEDEDEKQPDAEKRTHKFKHNKEDVEVDISTDEKLTDHLQRSLALDKERERKNELEKTLDRAAKLAGFKDHTEYAANLDRIELQQQEKEKNAYNELRKELREEATDAGLDPDKLEAYLDNHPVMKEAQKAIQERDSSKVDSEVRTYQSGVKAQWDEVFSTFPDIEKRGITFVGSQVVIEGDNTPDWFVPDMVSKLESGYKPIDAYKLAHMDKIQTQSKKATEQKLIKQQQLGNRSQVQGNAIEPSNEPTLMPQHASLAAEFGVDLKGVRQQQKLLNSRR